jgi:Flp pilus assembly protein TadD
MIGLRRFADAIPTLESVLAVIAKHPATLSNLGLCHYALGQFDQAVSYLEQCHATGERGPDLLRLLVSTYHHVGRIDEAAALAAANMELAERDGALAGVFALAFLDSGDAARAARCATLALASNDQSIDGLIVQGTLGLGRLETDIAVRQFGAVIEQAPENGRAWIGLGTAALLKQDLARARVALRQGVEHMPGHVGSWHVLAWTELMTGELDEAQRLFTHSLELDRNFSESHGGLAAVAAIRGDRATATREIEVANRLDRACVSAKFAESVLSSAAGQPERARELIVATIGRMTGTQDNPLASLLARLARR